MSVEEKLRKLRGKRTLEILINSQREKFSAEFYGNWGIRVECTVTSSFLLHSIEVEDQKNDTSVEQFENKLSDVLEQYAPLKEKTYVCRPLKPVKILSS